MKISQLERQSYLAAVPLSEDNSYVILNYAANDSDAAVTSRVTLKELSNMMINNHNLMQYATDNNIKSTKYTNQEYAQTNSLGQYITADDRTVLDSAVTEVAYDTTNKRLTVSTRGGSAANVVSTASLLADMDLNYTDSDAAASKFVKAVGETNGIIAVTHENFSPSITWTDAVDGTNSNKPTINISVAGNSATAQTPNEATTALYGITKLSNAIDSSSEVLAATPKAVKSAIESLDITQITNTAGKTVATIDEADGKVSATFQDISILSSQISDKGTANCVATLDANGHIPSSQLPSYVDDVVEGTLSTFPATGETGKIYVDTTTNTSYRWSGSIYVKVASDLSLGETSSTAYRGDYGAAAYAHAVTNKGSAFSSGLYKITTNAEGHVTAAVAVEKADITTLGIPESDTTYEMDGTYNASTNKVATESTVSTAVSGLYTKPAGGIPASDLADTYFSIPELPTTDGTYTLQVVIATGEDPVFSWVSSTT